MGTSWAHRAGRCWNRASTRGRSLLPLPLGANGVQRQNADRLGHRPVRAAAYGHCGESQPLAVTRESRPGRARRQRRHCRRACRVRRGGGPGRRHLARALCWRKIRARGPWHRVCPAAEALCARVLCESVRHRFRDAEFTTSRPRPHPALGRRSAARAAARFARRGCSFRLARAVHRRAPPLLLPMRSGDPPFRRVTVVRPS
jgi:hypothetical protein